MTGSNGKSNDQRLDSWKEIAAYLRRDERTAIRWEKDRGLPVHRVPGGKRQAVFAYPAELDAWLRRDPDEAKGSGGPSADEGLPGPKLSSSPQGTLRLRSGRASEGASFSMVNDLGIGSDGGPPTRVRRRAIYSIAIVLLFGSVAGSILFLRSLTSAHTSNLPVRAAFTLNSLQAFDADGKVLWSYRLPGIADSGGLEDGRQLDDGVRIGDFRGDGDCEVLALLRLRVGPNANRINRMEVDMFSGEGKLLWKYVPQGHLVFPTHDLQDNWSIQDILVARGEKKQIWVAVDHAIWGHSFLASLDPANGNPTLRFVNTGTLSSLDEMTTTRGTFVLAGGFNNEYDSGSLAVIDESEAFAVSPQSEGTRHKCMNCAKGNPDYYFVFPRSEVNVVSGFYPDSVQEMHVMERQIELGKKETEWINKRPKSFYLLDRQGPIRPVSVSFDTDYDLQHQQYEREGKLNHSLKDCPERLHPQPVRMWTPAAGWAEIRIR